MSQKDRRKLFGQMLRVLRKKGKITQKSAAKGGGITQSALSKVERGVLMPRLDVGVRLLRAVKFNKKQVGDLFRA
jgi:transcriptional regulator with XRE-family HTH domain